MGSWMTLRRRCRLWMSRRQDRRLVRARLATIQREREQAEALADLCARLRAA